MHIHIYIWSHTFHPNKIDLLLKLFHPVTSYLLQRMLQQIIIHKPEDPLALMMEYLKKDNDNGNYNMLSCVSFKLTTLYTNMNCFPCVTEK